MGKWLEVSGIYRLACDWRWLRSLPKNDPRREYGDYLVDIAFELAILAGLAVMVLGLWL